ncbi:MAG: hypothetical protein ACI88A_001775 [Paraglaciecola sp.]|jgi:hypothetical protein
MHVDLSDIELAMEFVSSDYSFDNEAYVNSETGEIYYSGDAVDEELPDDIYENDKYILIPSKRDLDLGKRVALDFAAKEMPDEFNNVYSIFCSRGAYSKFKSLLHSLESTDKWYAYENKAMRDAVIEWCKENSIQYKSDT